MEADLEALARRAADGDREALDAVVRAVQDDVYRLAMRMLSDPDAAADATQEVLVKVVRHLPRFRGESSIRTWSGGSPPTTCSRCAARGASTRCRSRASSGCSRRALRPSRAAGPQRTSRCSSRSSKLGCTHGMLMCLDRDHRMAFVLGAVFELDGTEAAEIVEIEPSAYCKRLSRARERMRAFMERNCGLVDERAACRCRSQIRPSIEAGLMDPERLVYALHPGRAR